MSQAFEILCPVCRSVVPPEAPGCPTCAERRTRAFAAPTEPAGEAPATVDRGTLPPSPATAGGPVPNLSTLSMKDYHRVVRASYHANERPPTASGRVRAYLPFALLVVLLIVGAAVIFGHL